MRALLKSLAVITLIAVTNLYAGDDDPQRTLSPALKDKTTRDIIDTLQSDYHQQQARDSYISTLNVTPELVDALLTQWHFLNENFNSNKLLPRFVELDRKTQTPNRKHGLFAQNLQMRIMGAIHSLLTHGNGADLTQYTAPTRGISFSKEQVDDLVDRLAEMQTYMGDRLFSYECFETDFREKNGQISKLTRHIELVPAFWVTIVYSLHSHRVLEPKHVKKLAPTATTMLASHGQAFQGIVRFIKIPVPDLDGANEESALKTLKQFQDTSGAHRVATMNYKGKVLDIWKRDFNSLNSYDNETTFYNPLMAKRMNPLVAGVSFSYMRDFILQNSDQIDLASIPGEQLSFDPNEHSATEGESVATLVNMAGRLMHF